MIPFPTSLLSLLLVIILTTSCSRTVPTHDPQFKNGLMFYEMDEQYRNENTGFYAAYYDSQVPFVIFLTMNGYRESEGSTSQSKDGTQWSAKNRQAGFTAILDRWDMITEMSEPTVISINGVRFDAREGGVIHCRWNGQRFESKQYKDNFGLPTIYNDTTKEEFNTHVNRLVVSLFGDRKGLVRGEFKPPGKPGNSVGRGQP